MSWQDKCRSLLALLLCRPPPRRQLVPALRMLPPLHLGRAVAQVAATRLDHAREPGARPAPLAAACGCGSGLAPCHWRAGARLQLACDRHAPMAPMTPARQQPPSERAQPATEADSRLQEPASQPVSPQRSLLIRCRAPPTRDGSTRRPPSPPPRPPPRGRCPQRWQRHTPQWSERG